MGIGDRKERRKKEGKRGKEGQVCPLCGGGNLKGVYIHATGLPLVRCLNCGLLFFVFPEETQNQTPGYWTGGGSRYNLDVYTNPEVIKAAENSCSRYLDWLDNEVSTGKLIDYGCGIGTFVRLAQERGWQAYGLDISEVPVKYAQKQGLSVWTIAQWYEQKQAQVEKEKVDVITIFDVIEHLENPAKTIRMLSSLLRDKGILLVETPSASYFFRQLSLWISRLSCNRIDPARFFFYPDHRFYFTPKTLTRLLSDCGFKVTWCKKTTTPLAKIMHKLRQVHRAGRLTQSIAWSILRVTKLLGGNKIVMSAVKDKINPG